MSSIIRGSDDFDTSEAFGQGQVWTDVTGSRVLTTTYTNSTGKPIFIVITSEGGATTYLDAYIDGVLFSTVASTTFYGSVVPIILLVPNASTYSITRTAGTNPLTQWWELR